MKESKAVGYIQVGDQKIPIDGTVTITSTPNWWMSGCEERKALVATKNPYAPKNPYVPKEIHVDRFKKVMVVKWEDDTETKVTCDAQDNFSEDVGFMAALTEYVFGSKHQFKEKWWKIIQRRIKYHNTQPPMIGKKNLKNTHRSTKEK